ncbi:MAG TPA: UvrD-helicase domain-containing protein [bacterium]|jgi:DNA helicase-2/ATP-dependent DNA helicase PcrA|nr:UvrD-helicase domain-containing protein [bacterium]
MAVISGSPDLSTLNQPQREAAVHGEGPLLILAGAGSGKTRVITTRVAWLIQEKKVDPKSVLAVTFTNRAAGEMKERLAKLIGRDAVDGMFVSTFHAFCVRFLRVEAPKLGFSREFSIFDDDDQTRLVKECMHEIQIDEKQVKARALLWRIGQAKNAMLSPGQYAEQAEGETDQLAASVYKLYQAKLKSNQAMDFDDLINHSVDLLRGDQATLKKWQERLRWFMVDEYQDINPAQYQLIRMLSAASRNLVVVGDDDQSIYKFRGADIRNILDFEKDFPDATVVKLEQNYRSTQRILEAAWAVVKRNEGRKDKKLWTQNALGEPITFYQAPDEVEEGRYIAGQIVWLNRRERRPLGDFVVLYRTNAQSRAIEEAMRREALPYRIVGGMRFYDRMEVKDCLCYLRLLLNPDDLLSLKRVINMPPRGIGDLTLDKVQAHAWSKTLGMFEAMADADKVPGLQAKAVRELKKFTAVISELRAEVATSGPARLLSEVVKRSGYLDYWMAERSSEAEMRVENVKELVASALDFEERGREKTLAAYLEMVALASTLDKTSDNADQVTLMTLHNAKGLEYPVVFLAGLEEGLFPHANAVQEEGGVEEERRLCYVGITRAREKLHLSCAISRRSFGNRAYNPHSRFLDEIPPDLMEGFQALRDGDAHTAGGGTTVPFLEDLPPDEMDRAFNFRLGDRVRHTVFGTGMVIKARPDGPDQRLTVSFMNYGRKEMIASKSNLEKLSPDNGED